MARNFEPLYRSIGLPAATAAYLEAGEGDPVLLLHGFASNAAVNWGGTGWIEELAADDRRVVAPDLRGHGRSGKFYRKGEYDLHEMATDAFALLDALGVGRADVVGYSMGARVAAMMAIARPERVRSVVIAGMGAALIEGNPDASSIADAFDLESLDLVRGRSERMFRRFAEWTGSDLRALAACMRGQSGGLQPDRLSAIVSPTLFAVGSLDRLAGSPVPLAKKVPGSEVLLLEGADHMFAPGHSSFKAGVLDFLRRRP